MRIPTLDDTAILTQAHVFVGPDGSRLPYRRYLPVCRPDQRIPLVLFLHGAGERGTDNRRQLIHGVPALLGYLRDRRLPAAVIAPQCPDDPARWVDVDWSLEKHAMPAEPSKPMALVHGLLDETIATLPVDPDRVYVTGISMGGYGTWDILQRRAATFAAAMVLCGGGDESLAANLVSLPLRVFHGEKDEAVPVCRSRAMVAAIQAAGGKKVLYRETPSVGHDIWTAAYSDPGNWDWLFAQKRGS